MILSDRQLRELWPGCDPGPASLDVHLGERLQWWPEWVTRDPRIDQSHIWQDVVPEEDGAWEMRPGVLYLATTYERVHVPNSLAVQVDGRSGWARNGVVMHLTAGFLDPGFSGQITLEMMVVGAKTKIWSGARVAQLIVHTLMAPCERPYLGSYQLQEGPQPSRLYLNPDVIARWPQYQPVEDGAS